MEVPNETKPDGISADDYPFRFAWFRKGIAGWF
jgi:hypothetical protein